jgi:hypothetical protein
MRHGDLVGVRFMDFEKLILTLVYLALPWLTDARLWLRPGGRNRLWGWDVRGEKPRVAPPGMEAGRPWALGFNPVGIGGLWKAGGEPASSYGWLHGTARGFARPIGRWIRRINSNVQC